MAYFRKRKRLCRKTWRTYKANKLTHTPEAKALKKRWLLLVRQHNRRRVVIETKKNVRTSANANTAFNRDPFAVAYRMFNGKKSKKKPEVSKTEADM